jgi:hypothetical protein
MEKIFSCRIQEQTSYRAEGIVRFEVKCEIIVSIHITSCERSL